MSETSLNVIEICAYIVTMVTLVTIVWLLALHFAQIKDSLKTNSDLLKRYFSSLDGVIKWLNSLQHSKGSIDVDLSQLTEPINRLNEISQRLDDLYQLSHIKNEKNRLEGENTQLTNQIGYLETNCLTFQEQIDKLNQELADKIKIKQDLDHVTMKSNRLESSLKEREKKWNELKDATKNIREELKDFRGRIERYEEYLPVSLIDQICREVTNQINKENLASSSLHYMYSRLAVLLAINNLKIEADEKSVMLRDAFDDFDKAMYAQFMGKKNTLQLLRALWEKELTKILDGVLRFRWPKVGDALDLHEHRQETENGKAIIKDVKTAILFSGSGSLIQKAVVIT